MCVCTRVCTRFRAYEGFFRAGLTLFATGSCRSHKENWIFPTLLPQSLSGAARIQSRCDVSFSFFYPHSLFRSCPLHLPSLFAFLPLPVSFPRTSSTWKFEGLSDNDNIIISRVWRKIKTDEWSVHESPQKVLWEVIHSVWNFCEVRLKFRSLRNDYAISM